jgi:hypothetical protein
MWLLESFKAVLNSVQFSTFISAAFAAAFGAYAGALASSRNETKRAVIAELNSIAAARMLAFSICNKFLGLKRQLILPIYEDYQQGRSKFVEAQQAFAAGDRSRTAEFVGNFRTISPIWLPTESLEKQIIERISIRGRGLAAVVDLIGAVEALDQAIKYRTDLVSEFYKEPPTISQLDLAQKYYGLQNARGVIDEKFYSNVEALYKQTDDCIFFSKILADDLFEYGCRLRRRYRWRFHLRSPKLVREKWDFPETRRLLPNENNYVDWLRGFPKVPSRLTRLRKWLFRETA